MWIVTPHSKQSHAVLTLCDKGGLHVEFVCHSERRTLFSESDEVVNKKIKTALEAALHPIFCIGETLQERVENRVEEVLERQIRQGLKDVSAQDFHEVVIAL